MSITIPPAPGTGGIDLSRRCSVEDLISLAYRVAGNPTPGLLERWIVGLVEAKVLCPFGCTWESWLAGVRAGELEKLPWE